MMRKNYASKALPNFNDSLKEGIPNQNLEHKEVFVQLNY
jgi:hypothetical protein